MIQRTIVALAALAAASAAQAQEPAAPPASTPAETEEAAGDEPLNMSRREEVVVTGQRAIPVQPPERVMTIEQRQRHQAESRCIVAAQESTDPNRVDLSTPEDTCRRPQP